MTPPVSLIAALAGKYEIERELGRGGMAIVYLATEAKHGRRVALKVLDPDIAAAIGAERFLNEIRVAASLQHPNLLPLFDSGEADNLLYYVMPYVEGESLRVRLDRERQLPIDDALHIASAVASALDHAHRHGVVHRDLKPENILLRDGEPVVADFGVALALANSGSRMTQTGVALGTPQYMSPEQASAERNIDGRTDIYALGAVLYEMLTGEPPHSGPTAHAVVARILADSVRPMRGTRHAIPQHVEDAVTRALAKLPADRWNTAGEFASALRSHAFPPRPAAMSSWKRVVLPIAAGAFVAGLALGVVASTMIRPPQSSRAYAFVVTLPDSAAVSTGMAGTGGDIAISRDGRTLAYKAAPAGGGDVGRGIWIRRLDEIEARPLRGLERGDSPRFSPDGKRLMYAVGTSLFQVELVGERSSRVVENAIAFDWMDNESIVFSRGTTMWPDSARGSELWVTAIQNPAPRRVVARDPARGILAVSYPSVLPGGDAALVTIWKGDAGRVQQEIAVASLVDGSITELGAAGTTARYAMGHLIFARSDGSLNSAPFSPRTRRITGTVTQLAPSVVIKAITGWADFDVSEDGTIAYVGGSDSRRHLTLVDRSGRAQRLGTEARRYFTPRFSQDGRMIAVEVGSMSGFDVWNYDLEAKTLSAITTDLRSIRPGGWMSDGTILFLALDRGIRHTGVQSRSPDGRIDRRLIPDSIWIDEVSAGGRFIAYRANGSITLVTPNESNPVQLLVPRERQPGPMRLSSDGRFIVYESRASAGGEIIVQSTGNLGGAVQISSGGGTEPVWSPRGDEVFYRANSGLIAAKLAFDPLRVMSRDTLFRDVYLRGTFAANYDASPDGQRFVMIENESPDVYPTVLVNRLRR
jgi:eukaryotic-like serine/threonine-protein kinase